MLMKKILFLLLFVPSICLGQSFLRLPYSYILHVYQGDTIKQMFSGDTAKFYTDKSKFSFNKPIFVNGVQLGSGGALDSSKLVTQFDIQRGLIVTNSLNTYPGININTTHDYSYGLNVYTEGMAAIPIQGNSLYCDTLFLLKKWNNTKFLVDNIGNVNIKGQFKTYNGADSAVLSNSSGLKLYGNATVYDDLFFPFSTGKQGSADYPSFNVDSMYHSFSIDTTAPGVCIMYFTIQMPHSWKEGSTIYPHVHYKHETAVGTPTFKMKYKWYPLGGSTAIGYNWYTMGTTTGTTDKTNQMVYGASGISGSGKGISSIIVCAVYLSGQTGTGNVNAYQFDIHYEKDAIGSRTTTSK